MTRVIHPPADPPSTEDINVAHFSRLEVVGDTRVQELDDDRWKSRRVTKGATCE